MRILIITILFSLSEAFAQQQSEVRKVDSLTKEKSIQLEAVELSRRMSRRHMLDNGIRIDKAEIRRTFKFLGALDPLNAIRTLPGVSSGGDLNSGLYIRGGENGHNLIAYNGVTLYNPHHLFGLFPLLNPELVNHVQFHNGAAPASLSGRLSAYILLESAAESFDSVKNELVFNATLLSADLTVKRKLGKGFFGEAQARKSFLNALVWPYVNRNSPTQYDIYDLNLNLYYRSQNGLTQLTGYQGEDKFRMEFNRRTVYQEMDWGNKLIGLKHRQQLGGGQSLMLGLSETQYNYELDLDYNSSGSNILLGNRVNSLQYDLRYKLQKKHSLELGYVGSLHRVRPVDVQWQAATEGQQLKDLRQRIQQHQFYAHSQIHLSDRWKTQAGLAFVQYAARDINDVETAKSNWTSLDPTLTLSYLLNTHFSMKVAWNRSSQHIQNIAMSATSLPLDFWIGGSKGIKPSRQDQYTLGFYYSSLRALGLEFSAEGFYRAMDRVYEFNGDINQIVERSNVAEAVYQGRARSYGIELYGKLQTDRLQSTASYTFSRSFRWFDDLNEGARYPFKYDRPHRINMVTAYRLGPLCKLSASFNMESGLNYTPEIGRYFLNNNIISEYGAYNSARMKLYHRLDLGVTRAFATKRRAKHELGLHIINVYNRKNALFRLSHYEGGLNEPGQYIRTSQKDLAVLPLIPMFSYSVRL